MSQHIAVLTFTLATIVCGAPLLGAEDSSIGKDLKGARQGSGPETVTAS
jgi:hypothetical protein